MHGRGRDYFWLEANAQAATLDLDGCLTAFDEEGRPKIRRFVVEVAKLRKELAAALGATDILHKAGYPGDC